MSVAFRVTVARSGANSCYLVADESNVASRRWRNLRRPRDDAPCAYAVDLEAHARHGDGDGRTTEAREKPRAPTNVHWRPRMWGSRRIVMGLVLFDAFADIIRSPKMLHTDCRSEHNTRRYCTSKCGPVQAFCLRQIARSACRPLGATDRRHRAASLEDETEAGSGLYSPSVVWRRLPTADRAPTQGASIHAFWSRCLGHNASKRECFRVFSADSLL